MTGYLSDLPQSYRDEADMPPDTARGAYFSPDERYRYALWRVWDASLPGVTWVMLNPSTADDRNDDATVAKCMRFARRWGYGRVDVYNLFAFRARRPRDLRAHMALYGEASAVGPRTDQYLLRHLAQRGPMVTFLNNDLDRRHGDIVVCAWGANAARTDRARHVLNLLTDAGAFLHRVGESTTKEGQPPHPLFLREDKVPVLFMAG